MRPCSKLPLLLLLFVLATMVLFMVSTIRCDQKNNNNGGGGVKVPEEQEKFTAEQCLSFGFVSDQLPCGVCKAFSTFVSDATLISQCNGCCTTALDSPKKYKGALLEVCGMKLQSQPELQNFIEKRSRLFKTLKIRFRYHVNPSLSMERSSDGKVTKLPIEKWSNDDIFNYLSQTIN